MKTLLSRRSRLAPFALALGFFVNCISLTVLAADNLYDETADARAEIKTALAQAGTNQNIIVVFGANWCADCKVLDAAMKAGTTGALLPRDFQIVKVNVGQMDKNLDLAAAYGVALTNGIPFVVILSPKNKVLGTVRGEPLAEAQKMGSEGIYELLMGAAETAARKK